LASLAWGFAEAEKLLYLVAREELFGLAVKVAFLGADFWAVDPINFIDSPLLEIACTTRSAFYVVLVFTTATCFVSTGVATIISAGSVGASATGSFSPAAAMALSTLVSMNVPTLSSFLFVGGAWATELTKVVEF
jgi:hypothetical protein